MHVMFTYFSHPFVTDIGVSPGWLRIIVSLTKIVLVLLRGFEKNVRQIAFSTIPRFFKVS